MKIDKKTIIAIVLGAAALVVVLYQMRSVIMPSASKTPPATASAAQSLPPATSTAVTSKAPAGGNAGVRNAGVTSVQNLLASGYGGYIANLKESDIDFSGAKFKDPMTPIFGGAEDVEPQNWVPVLDTVVKPVVNPDFEELAENDTLDGIVWNEKDPLALVNDQVVGVGEELEDGAVVTAITQDTVKFSRNGNRYYLVLREE